MFPTKTLANIGDSSTLISQFVGVLFPTKTYG
jgi:hypothetical protein